MLEQLPVISEVTGFVYVAVNPYLPGLVKIGSTLDLRSRLVGLSNSSIPGKYRFIYAAMVDVPADPEHRIHALLEHVRVDPDREFFSLEHDDAINFCSEFFRGWKPVHKEMFSSDMLDAPGRPFVPPNVRAARFTGKDPYFSFAGFSKVHGEEAPIILDGMIASGEVVKFQTVNGADIFAFAREDMEPGPLADSLLMAKFSQPHGVLSFDSALRANGVPLSDVGQVTMTLPRSLSVGGGALMPNALVDIKMLRPSREFPTYHRQEVKYETRFGVKIQMHEIGIALADCLRYPSFLLRSGDFEAALQYFSETGLPNFFYQVLKFRNDLYLVERAIRWLKISPALERHVVPFETLADSIKNSDWRLDRHSRCTYLWPNDSHFSQVIPPEMMSDFTKHVIFGHDLSPDLTISSVTPGIRT